MSATKSSTVKPAAKPVRKKELDVTAEIRNLMIQRGVKDEAIEVEYDDKIWTLMLRKKLVRPEGGSWNTLVYIDAYHMENDTHYSKLSAALR